MARGTPVLAINSGGPIESVKNGLSGYLLEQNEKQWAECMQKFIDDPKIRKKFAEFAQKYAHDEFSLRSMGEKLSKALLLLD